MEHDIEGRKRATVNLSPLALAKILNLPPGQTVVATEVSVNPPSVTFLIEGDGLPYVPVDAEAPRLMGTIFEGIVPDTHFIQTAWDDGRGVKVMEDPYDNLRAAIDTVASAARSIR